MKKNGKLLVLGAVLLILAAAWIFYAFPRTPEQMVPGLDLSACDRLTLESTWYPDDRADHQIRCSLVLTPGDEGFDEILNTLRTHEFSRSPFGWLSRNATKTHPISAGDIRWSIHCPCGDALFCLDNFFGDMSMTADPGDRYAKLHTRDGENWRSSIYDMISQNPNTEITKE